MNVPLVPAVCAQCGRPVRIWGGWYYGEAEPDGRGGWRAPIARMWANNYVHGLREKGKVIVKKAAAMLAVGWMALFVPHLQDSRQGCPAGTTAEGTSMTLICNAPSGATRCVQWAFGFTPNPADANDYTAYERRGVSDVGPWCDNATSPPPGSGGK